MFKDKSLGIYDTKSGFTQSSIETGAKSDALQSFIDGGKHLKGGIVQKILTGWHIFTGKKYDTGGTDWKDLKDF